MMSVAPLKYHVHRKLGSTLRSANSSVPGSIFNKCAVQPEGFVVDDDMIDYITECYDWVMKRKAEPGTELFAERKVDPGAMFGRDDCSGTADITLIKPPRITMGDLKYGKGIFVSVKDNLQEILYAIGVLEEMAPEKRKEIKEVELVILQPRIDSPEGTIRNIVYSIEDIYAWAEWFRDKANETDNPNAKLEAGDSQCKFCPVKSDRQGCPELKSKALEVFDVKSIVELESKVTRSPESLTTEERALILDNAELIESFIKAVKATAQSDLEKRHPCTG